LNVEVIQGCTDSKCQQMDIFKFPLHLQSKAAIR
jgi:hypothetical protein